jgi:hypothetical protein
VRSENDSTDARTIEEVVIALDSLRTVDEVDDLEALEAGIEAFFDKPDAESHLDVWFRLFERFPEEDAYEIFWTIVHALENYESSESLVISSVRRKPARFPLLMVNRLLNDNRKSVDGVDLLDVLREVSENPLVVDSVRANAVGYLEHQNTKGVD